jgi:hypothetical protein
MEHIRNKHLFYISHMKYGNVGGENGCFRIAKSELMVEAACGGQS